MTQYRRSTGIPSVIKKKPLQAGKFGGILLSLIFGIGGFFRIINATAIIDNPLLGDGQFLALVLIPLLSFGLVILVFIETLVTGYHILRSKSSFKDRIAGRTGYLVIRGAEAAVAIAGMTVMFAVLPTLFAESTPAPAGVGAMLLLMAVGLGILVASFVRSAAELFVYK